jgi:hypothetical protein
MPEDEYHRPLSDDGEVEPGPDPVRRPGELDGKGLITDPRQPEVSTESSRLFTFSALQLARYRVMVAKAAVASATDRPTESCSRRIPLLLSVKVCPDSSETGETVISRSRPVHLTRSQ